MDLWIRSQDRESLIKCNKVDIMWDDGVPYIFLNGNFPDDIVGSYLTKERALKVLDDIQSLLIPRVIYKTDPNYQYNPYNPYFVAPVNNNIEYQDMGSYVYEMPME